MDVAFTVENEMEGQGENPAATVLHAAPGAPSCRVSVVIPTLNEAENLPHVFSRLPTDLHEVDPRRRWIEGQHVEVARALCPTSASCRRRAAARATRSQAGFAAATGDIIVMLDADGSADPARSRCSSPRSLDGADFAKGSRFLPAAAAPTSRRLRAPATPCLTGS